jgi:hypothetical protein
MCVRFGGYKSGAHSTPHSTRTGRTIGD